MCGEGSTAGAWRAGYRSQILPGTAEKAQPFDRAPHVLPGRACSCPSLLPGCRQPRYSPAAPSQLRSPHHLSRAQLGCITFPSAPFILGGTAARTFARWRRAQQAATLGCLKTLTERPRSSPATISDRDSLNSCSTLVPAASETQGLEILSVSVLITAQMSLSLLLLQAEITAISVLPPIIGRQLG